MDLQVVDIFGIGIGLRYLNKQEYQTKFGAVITILIVIVGSELFLKNKPEVISAERFVSSPERFNIKRNTFNFAIGAQFPGNYSHFIDESIYSITAEMVKMEKLLNSTTQKYEPKWTRTQVPMHPCTPKDFEVKETLNYFNNLADVEKMYCIDYDSTDLFFEGNFDQDSYGVIQLTFKMCENDIKCRKKEDILKILTNSFVAYYSNDILVNPKEFNPFSKIGRDFYWNISPNVAKDAYVAKDVYMFYRNAYVESDQGIFFENKSFERDTLFSYQNEQIIFGESKYFFSFFMRFEKAKESIFHRKYKKLDSVLAEIGGISKALMIIGFILCMPINQLKLHQQLSNSLFTFQNRNQNYQLNQPKFEGQKLIQIIEATQQYNKNQQFLDAEQSTKNKLCIKDNFFKDPSQQQMMSLEHIQESIFQKDSKTSKEDSHIFINNLTQKGISIKQNNKIEGLELVTKQISLNIDQQQEQFDAKITHSPDKQQSNDNTQKRMSGSNLLQIIKAQKQMKKSIILQQQSEHKKDEITNQNLQTNNLIENILKINEKDKQDHNKDFGQNQYKLNKLENYKDKVSNNENIVCNKNDHNKCDNNSNINGERNDNIKCNNDDNKMEINFFRNYRKSIQLNGNPFQNNVSTNPSDQKKQEQQESKSLILKWQDYIKYYVFPWGSFSKKKKEIDYSIEKIYQHLDMLYIVQKLLELEKLKQLLLDEDQMRLISFLPKPLIDVDKIDKEKQEKKKKIKQLEKLNTENPKKIKRSHVITLLDDVQIDEKERAKQAYLAINNIMKKDKLTKIDKKIIEMIDGSIIENIENYVEYLEEIETDLDQNNKNQNNKQQDDNEVLTTANNQLLSDKTKQVIKGNLNNEDIIIEFNDSEDTSSYNYNNKENTENNYQYNQKNETTERQDSKYLSNYNQTNLFISPQSKIFSPIFDQKSQDQQSENKEE